MSDTEKRARWGPDYAWTAKGLIRKRVWPPGAKFEEFVDTLVPVCHKCLNGYHSGVVGLEVLAAAAAACELNECFNCGHEPSLTGKERVYCDNCITNHKRPSDCGDCGRE